MAKPVTATDASEGTSAGPMAIAALVGLGFASASTWVHYHILRDPLYSSICDVNATFSCTEAYTSRYGSIAGVPVALIGVLYFAFVLVLIALCQRSRASRQNLPGYVFAAATLGLAGALYLGYASFFILKTVCLLCVGSYAAIITLFLLSGRAARYPMSTLPGRAVRDVNLLLRTPAALTAMAAFVAAAIGAVILFPSEPISAASATPSPSSSAAAAAAQAAAPPPATQQAAMQQLEQYLTQQPRVPIVAAANGASVVIIKFNDYQCPPCGQTFREYKPILAKLQAKYPGKISFQTRDFPLDAECNSLGGPHPSGCEAAVAVRLAREKGKAAEMEDYLFANQPSFSRDFIKQGLATVAGVNDYDARYDKTLELVKGDIAQGIQLNVRGTPTFFMNGIRLPSLRAEFFEAAVEWELKHAAGGK